MIKPSLMLAIHGICDGEEHVPYITADMQVWDDDKHIVTIDMRLNVKPDPWTLKREDCLEQWAAQMGRQVARMLEDNFLQCVNSGALNHGDSFDMVTQVTPDPKQ